MFDNIGESKLEFVVWQRPGRTAKQLADIMGLERSLVSTWLESLSAEGVIESKHIIGPGGVIEEPRWYIFPVRDDCSAE